MDNKRKVEILKQIIKTGACSITPPIFGWLVEKGIITPDGFDMEKAKQELEARE